MVGGVLWWWAALRLALAPGAGLREGLVTATGWGLSLLPVHSAPARPKVRRRQGGAGPV
ncbi:hypothetical protein ACSMX9_23275 [Streptomyces sp. LE64]|uniref:hypothetical protein n=1 Tax=unclassified Streptomyces TaxID=2593676 RepID=UPI003319C08D